LQILYDPEETPGLVQDAQGRDHVVTSRSGKLTIVNRSAKFMGSNSQTHMNDVYRIMNETERASSSEPKPILWIIADGGPDWNVKSPLALMSYGRLFRRLKKDVLGVSMPAPGHSRANEIERKWAPVTNLVAGVVLSASLPGKFTVRMIVPCEFEPWQCERSLTLLLVLVMLNLQETMCPLPRRETCRVGSSREAPCLPKRRRSSTCEWPSLIHTGMARATTVTPSGVGVVCGCVCVCVCVVVAV
jgi:hypothetical protein